MALTQNDKNEIKEIIQNSTSGVHARTEAKFDVIDLKLTHILEQTTKHNGRMTTIEEKVRLLEDEDLIHFTKCPVAKDVQTLKDDKRVRVGIKEFVIATVMFISVSLGIAFTSVKLYEANSEAKQEKLIEMIKQELSDEDTN